jgi:rubrerythrin
MKHKVKWCPQNGCGIFNGAAMPYPVVTCKICGLIKIMQDVKVCPSCGHCISCGRIIKKFFVKGNNDN